MGCCSGVWRNSILMYSCSMPGKYIFDSRLSRTRGSSPACPRGRGTCSSDRGALDPGRSGCNAGRSECKTGGVEPSSAAWCGLLRRVAEDRGGIACCSEAISAVGVLRGTRPESSTRGWSATRNSRFPSKSRERRPTGEPCVPVPWSSRGGADPPHS